MLVVPAPAKVNLSLRVLGRRPDGFHELDTVIVPIDLADTVEVHAIADPGAFRTLSLSLQVEGDPARTLGVPLDESNLALRAAKALADRVDARGFAEITLHKRIPPAAGLGGGSADAAAVLRALDTLWGTGLDPQELSQVAAEVGSDVPALLEGRAVRARGRGERIEPVDLPPARWVLVIFGFGVSTAEAYAWWDADTGTRVSGAGSADGEHDTAVAAPDLADPDLADPGPLGLGGRMVNDLEGPVIRRHPIIGVAKAVLLSAGCIAAVMSGSGPTVVGLLPAGRSTLDPLGEDEILRLSASGPIYVVSWPGRSSTRSPS